MLKVWEEFSLLAIFGCLPGILILVIFGCNSCLEDSYDKGKKAGYKEACQDFYYGQIKLEPVFTQDGKVVDWIEVNRKENNNGSKNP